jgi:tetratricopeptide (TPR) repeat protein
VDPNPSRIAGHVAQGALLAALCLASLSCAQDPAEQEYIAALRGEETGMTRAEQLALVERAIALKPHRAWYRETHAIYSIDVGSFEVASADLDTAITLADRPYLRFLRGLVACQRGEFANSMEDFDRAIAEQPTNSQFYRGRSLARSALGRYPGAFADAERLCAMAPQQGESHYALGVALAGIGRLPEAIQSFDESLRRRPELIYPLQARADAYERLGEASLADADRREADRRRQEGSGYAPGRDPFRY